MANDTAVTELIIDSGEALQGAQQFDQSMDQVAASSKKGAAAADGVSDAIERNTTTVQVSARTLRQQKAALDEVAGSVAPVFNAQQNLTKSSDQVSKAIAGVRTQMMSGTISATEGEQAIAKLQGRQTQLSSTARQLAAGEITVNDAQKVLNTTFNAAGEAYRLSYTEAEILRSGLVNTVQSLAAGQGAARTFETQIFQIGPALGGLTRALGLALPVIAAIGVALAAVVVAFGLMYAAASRDSAIRDMTNQLRFAGIQSQELAKQIDTVATATAHMSSASTSDLRKVGVSIESAANGAKLPLQSLMMTAEDLSAALGVKLPEAGAILALAFRDPTAAAKKLQDDGFRGLTDAQDRLIERLQNSGDKLKATGIIIAALNKNVGGASQNLSGIGKAWQGLENTLSDVGTKLEPVGTFLLQIATWSVKLTVAPFVALAHVLGDIADGFSHAYDKGKEFFGFVDKALPQVTQQKGGGVGKIAPDQDEIDRLDKFARGLDAIGQRRQDLGDMIKSMRAADPTRYADAIARARSELAALRGPIGDVIKGLHDQADAYTVPEGASRALEQAVLSLQNAEEQEGRAASPAELAQARAEALKTLTGQYVDLTVQLDQQIQTQQAANAAFADGQAAVDHATNSVRAHIDALKFAEEGTADYAKEVAVLTKKYDDLSAGARTAQANGLLQSSQDDLAIAQKEADLVGQLPEDRQREIDLLRTRLQLQHDGIDAEGDQGKAILANVAAADKLNATTARANQIVDEISSDVENSLGNAFQSIFSGTLKGFKDLGQQILSLFGQIAAKIATTLIFHPEVSLDQILNGLTGSGSGVFSAGGTGATLGSSSGTITGASGIPITGNITSGADTSGLFGNGGFLGLGMSGGSLLGIAGSALPGLMSGNYAQAGLGLAGSALGAIFGGPLGMVLGGLGGNLLGSLFDGPPQHHDALVTWGVNRTSPGGMGRVGITSATSDHQDNNDNYAKVAAMVAAINKFANKFGLDINTKGDRLGVSVGDDRDPSFQGSAKASMQKFLASHDFSSDDKVVDYALKHNTAKTLPELRQAILAAEKGAADLTLQLNQTGHATSSVQSQMMALRQEFLKDTADAEKYGKTRGDVRKAFARQFNVSTSDSLLAINNPQAAALAQESRDAAARLSIAKKLGADQVKVEKLNAAERLQILEQFANETVAQLKDKLAASGHDISDVQSTMTNLMDQFKADMKAAAAFHAVNDNSPTSGDVAAAYARQFQTQIGDQLLALMNPEKAALQQAQRDAQARLQVARTLGVDLTKVEKLNAQERLQIVKQYNQAEIEARQQTVNQARQLLTQTAQSLDDYTRSLEFGSQSALTPQQQLALAQRQFAVDAAAAAHGNVAAAQKLPELGDALLKAAQAMYGTGQGYANIYERVAKAVAAAQKGLGSDTAMQSAKFIVKAGNDNSKFIANTYRQEMGLLRKDVRELINTVRKKRGTA